MKKFVAYLILTLAASSVFAQTPPIVNVSTGEFIGNVNRNKIVSGNKLIGHDGSYKFDNYDAVIEANNLSIGGGSLKYLTFGAGLSGANFNGSTAVTATVDTLWLVNNYHKNWTAGDGLKLDSGTTYNGQVAKTASVDKANILAWINGLKKDFYIYIEMSPTTYDAGAYDTVSTPQINPFYYRNVTAIGSTSTNAGKTGVTIPLANGTNVMHSTTATVPSSYTASSFTVSSITASLAGNITYDKATSLTNSFIRTTNASGTSISSYTTNDKVVAMRYWTDGEIKGIDKWGNLIYFTSTILLNYSSVKALHPEITDSNPTVYYWSTYYNSTGGCWGTKRQLTNFNSSIGASNGGYGVTGIWIYPDFNSTIQRAVPVYIGTGVLDTINYPRKGRGDNSNADNTAAGYRWVVWGKYVREIFENADNTFLTWRQTTSTGEYYNGNKLWRPVKIEFFGDFKEIN